MREGVEGVVLERAFVGGGDREYAQGGGDACDVRASERV